MKEEEEQTTWRKHIVLGLQVGIPMVAAAVIVREFTGFERMARSAGFGWGTAAVLLISMLGLGGMINIGEALYRLVRHRKHLDEVKVKKVEADGGSD